MDDPSLRASRARPALHARLALLAVTLGVLLTTFFTLVRPWYLQWGASDLDARIALPGDAIVPAATQETRGITIDVGADTVWPWLAQVGQDRGGFYSFDLLENLVGCRMPVEDTLKPAQQVWHLGDKLWMYPPDKAGGIGYATLREYVPGRALAFATRMTGTPLSDPENGSWSFVLQPLDRYTTRLLIRGRGAADRPAWGVAFDRAIFEPMHFVMERRMMTSIKQLAEGQSRNRTINHLLVALWAITFGLFVVAAAGVLRAPDWRRPLAGLVSAAVVFQVLTFAQPDIVLSLLLVAVVTTILWGSPLSHVPHRHLAQRPC